MRYMKAFVTPSSKQQRNLSHMATEATTDHVKMWNARASTKLFSRHSWVKNQTRLHWTCLPKLMKSKGNVFQRLLMPLTLHTPVGWYGIPLTT